MNRQCGLAVTIGAVGKVLVIASMRSYLCTMLVGCVVLFHLHALQCDVSVVALALLVTLRMHWQCSVYAIRSVCIALAFVYNSEQLHLFAIACRAVRSASSWRGFLESLLCRALSEQSTDRHGFSCGLRFLCLEIRVEQMLARRVS